jgi:hypothetical protein
MIARRVFLKRLCRRMCGEGSASPVARDWTMGFALGSGFAQNSWAKGRTRGKARSFNSAAGEASLAAHPAAEPVTKCF